MTLALALAAALGIALVFLSGYLFGLDRGREQGWRESAVHRAKGLGVLLPPRVPEQRRPTP